jgi:glycosyltransferase involved in cell wall biosynthesis
MNIALDGTPVTDAPYTGIARYTEQLAAALGALHPEARITLESRPTDAGAIQAKFASRFAGTLERRWWSIGLPRRLREIDATLFHGTDFAVPFLGRTPAVVTVHDLSPLRAREWDMPAVTRSVARRLPGAIRRAAAVITPSQRVKEELIERFPTAREKTFVTPLAAAATFYPRPAAAAGDYVLYVGSGQRRKNLDLLVRVFSRVRSRLRKDRDLHLKVVGGGSQIELQSEVTRMAGVSDEDLARLYSGAAVFVYPSVYEGFGLPVLEAMACGAPVVTTRDTACGDLAGEAAWLVEGENEQQLEDALIALLERPSVAAELREKGKARAKSFSWQRTAELTWAVYQVVLQNAGL